MSRGWTDSGYFTIVSNYVLEDESISPQARFVYTLLVRYGRWKRVGEEKFLVTWVSRERLAKLTGQSDRGVSRNIRELTDKKLIERKRRPGGSSITYISNPAYAYNREEPETPGEPEPLESTDTADSPSCHGCHVDVPPVAPRHDTQCTTEDTQTDDQADDVEPNGEIAVSDKDVGVDKDITILSDNSRGEPGLADRKDKGNGTAQVIAGDSARFRAPIDEKPIGLLARRADIKLTSRPKSKIGVPADAVPIDDSDPQTAKELWREFQRLMVANHPGYELPGAPTVKELANCKKMLEEYGLEDIVGLFQMIASRWAVVMEKWPSIAKTPVPTFYAAFTLRRDLIPLVQAGKGLTSRTHRYDESAAENKNAPVTGWGDE